MSNDETATLDEVRALVARLDQLLTGAVTPFAAVNPDGTPGHVAAGELIESAWGNAVVDSLYPWKGVGVVNTNVAVPSFGQPSVIWVSKSFDTDNYWTTGEFLTIPAKRGGIYVATADVLMSTAATAVGDMVIDRLNGPTGTGIWFGYIPIAKTRITWTAVSQAQPGDQFRVRVYNPNGAAVTMSVQLAMWRVAL